MIPNGQRPEENQVSRTSSSCSRVKLVPLARTLARSVASSNVLPTTQFLPSLTWFGDVGGIALDGFVGKRLVVHSPLGFEYWFDDITRFTIASTIGINVSSIMQLQLTETLTRR